MAGTAAGTGTTSSVFANDPVAREIAARMRARNPKAIPLEYIPDVHPGKIPRHIAFIMDGNGRWAKSRGFPRIFGHYNGARAVREVLTACGDIGVEYVTLYSFSMENWKRPEDEVRGLMELCVKYLGGEREEFCREGIRVRILGSREGLPAEVCRAMDEVEAATANCRAATLCLAINYGSRAEIVGAARTLAARVQRGEITPGQIDESMFEGSLLTAGIPDPDLLVRTAGEMRISNYLLWQISYSELLVTDKLWPDFGREALFDAVREFSRRSRRFGGLEEVAQNA
jgi:undecaprenyl diphosphate synthase